MAPPYNITLAVRRGKQRFCADNVDGTRVVIEVDRGNGPTIKNVTAYTYGTSGVIYPYMKYIYIGTWHIQYYYYYIAYAQQFVQSRLITIVR